MDTVLSGMFDTHPLFQVDPSTREIITVEGSNTIAVQFDKRSQMVTFRVPRYFDNVDHFTQQAKIHFLNKLGQGDTVDAENIEEDAEDSGYILVTWVVDDPATQASGLLRVTLEFCVVEDNKYLYRWFTKPGKFQIAENINVTDKAAGVSSSTLMRIEAAIQYLESLEIDSATLNELVELTKIMSLELAEKVDGGYVTGDGYLILTSNDEDAVGPLGPFSGGGGGGGGGSYSASYTVTLTNKMDSRLMTAASGQEVPISFEYTSVDEEGYDDGNGVCSIYVNNVKKATLAVSQGQNTIDVSPYLNTGSNTVKIRVENSEGSARALNYTVTVVALSLSTTFSDMAIYDGDVTFSYTPVGSGTKTVYFLMDGQELGTAEVTASGKSLSYEIPAQDHGSHILTVYAEVVVDGITVRSNTLNIGMIFVDRSSLVPAIVTTFDTTNAVQGEILTIPYLVYHPIEEQPSVTLSVIDQDGNTISSKTISVPQSIQEWVVQEYPVGETIFRIATGEVSTDILVFVSENDIVIEPVTDSMTLLFDPYGRSNQESDPAVWSQGDIAATFDGIGFTSADGWLTDTDGAAILRLLPGSEVTIPIMPFAEDSRTRGLTIEVEMATHNVRDYDSVVMRCLSNGRGFKIASQYAEISSEQSKLSMQFKEDDKVRVSFVIEPKTLNRLIYVYVDGVMCGSFQYPEDDDFSQNPAAGLTIGAGLCGIDVYKIRLYNKGLYRNEILTNFVADRSTLAERIAAYKRNDILDDSQEISIARLPATLPYMIISCAELPQFKGDKKTCEITYVNPGASEKSFTATGVQIDVQGTSSAGYKKKNFKPKFKEGIVLTSTGATAAKFQLRSDSVPTDVFCLKADVASSEGANNVELVRLYNDICPFFRNAQLDDERVRWGIDGIPIIVFWQNTTTNEVKFWGKYNFNNDKSTAEVFGLTDGYESWETRNNTSNRVIYKSADFSGTAWQDDFEARYPEDNTDTTKLAAMCAWVVSTDREAATGNKLSSSVTYDGVTYTNDTAEYRLAKFKAEFEDVFAKAPTLFYYLFTEIFLMVDSRAKNYFPTYDPTLGRWYPLPYDMDTALGINNEGALVFDYDLEDTDQIEGANVFNGQNSVLWNNVRDAFYDDIVEMYRDLRTSKALTFEDVISRFEDHQAIWPEAVWNEDAYEKYLEPLLNDNDGAYMSMLQGDKASQRKWWLYNGLRYRDSKYQTGDSEANYITLRAYALGDITITAYSHIHGRIKYGSYTVSERVKRNVALTLKNPLDELNDTEIYIYDSDRLTDIGDLSPLKVGYANFAMAPKLQVLDLGSAAEGYTNPNLTELYVGNNESLTRLNIQNCTKMEMTVDLSGCVCLENIQAKGSIITAVTLPVGGKLKRMELPATIKNLTIRDQKEFETLDVDGYSAVETIRVENTPNIPIEAIVSGSTALSRVRIVGINWTAESESSLSAVITKLKAAKGLNASGDNVELAVVTGTVSVPSVSAALLEEINAAFPELVVIANGVPQYIARYMNYDNTVIHREVVAEGGNVINPVTAGTISAPTRPGGEDTGYVFKDFGTLPTDVHSNVTVIAQYVTAYRVRFMVDDTVHDTQWIEAGGSATTPSIPTKASTAQYSYTFSKWNGTYTNVTAPVDVVAVFTATTRTYTVYFYNGSTLLQTVTDVPYGSTASYTGTTPVDPSGNEGEFEGWSPSNANIQGTTSCYAVFASVLEVAEITDDWATIMASVADGTYKSKYKVGNYKPLDLGSEGTINMQIAAFNKDTLADGSGTAAITWISKELLATSKRMNPGLSYNYAYPDSPSWAASGNTWTSQNANAPASDAKATFRLNATEAGTLTISYKTSNGSTSNNKLTLLVNGEVVVSDYAGTTAVTHDVAVSAGDVVTVDATFTTLQQANYTATLVFSSTGAFTTDATIEDAPKRVVESHVEGTGTIGGWEKSEIRTYYQDTLQPLIPDPVASAIKAVTKTHPAYDTASTSQKFTQTTTDEVWMPSYDEMYASSRPYKALFPDNASRIKYKVGATSASWWWLRSAYNNSNFNNASPNGYYGSYNAANSGALPLGFCT